MDEEWRMTEKGLEVCRHYEKRWLEGASVEEIAAEVDLEPVALQILYYLASSSGLLDNDGIPGIS